MRAFIAIELDQAARAALVRVLDAEQTRSRGLRWVAPHQLHVTLKFLGDIDESRLPEIERIMCAASAAVAPFRLMLGRVGCFPSTRDPRVLWIAADDPHGNCARWLAPADEGLIALGIEPERRELTPHITLARSQNPAGSTAIRTALKRIALPALPSEIREVVLFESTLLPTGARHTPRLRIPLGV